MRPPDSRIDAQTRACIEAARTILPRVLRLRRPADQELRAFFRARSELGRRDRLLVYDLLFALFRWWGWVRLLLPPDVRDALVPSGPPGGSGSRSMSVPPLELPARDWHRCFLAAALCEDTPATETVLRWAEVCGIASPEAAVLPPREEFDRLYRAVFRLLQVEGPVLQNPADALLPAWVRPLFPTPLRFEQALAWALRRAPLWLRVRPGTTPELAADLDRIRATRHAVLHDAVEVGISSVNVYGLASFRKGLIEVQDLGSQAVCALCAPAPGQSWWDACAGSGGKTLFLAQAVGPRGSVLATDLRRRVLRNLRGRAARGRLKNIRVQSLDATRPYRLSAAFDGVLVDAPCSGSGTWRRNPDALWRLCPADLERTPERQFDLLAGVSPRVKPGGRLVYATCSLFACENREVVRRFLTTAPDFCLEPFEHPLHPGQRCEGMLQIWPWDGNCNAMFVARMRRRS
ncbi:MAG: RsmB/NOP family class I SAM-dependent RNA methyltransferase [Kiritimatiellaeota bacterium]|nr:RsmB/NOP family class I SAM-dependent RNA methyltransferase [Kiritimatiellota bacterium]